MELEMEMVDVAERNVVTDRLLAAAARLESAVERMASHEVDLEASTALEQRLKEAEATIAQLRAGGAMPVAGPRKTHAAGAMMAREAAAVEPGAVDAALVCLSPEQRIAVKAGLMRSGLLG